MERALASIQRIKELTPIPDADRIETATILGWRVVVKKGEFSVGSLCVFFEIDSILPYAEWNAFLDKKGTKQPVRLKTCKLKKQLSQGLALPMSVIPQLAGLAHEMKEGSNVTEWLGVTKHEPSYGKNDLNAIGVRPAWVYKTDETRVQSIPWILQYMNGKDCYVTQKLDGSSCSIANHETEGLVICSRNMKLSLEGDNRFVKVGKPIAERLPKGFLVQGELVGPGVQENRIGLKELDFYVFNVIDLSKPGFDGRGEFLGFEDMRTFCEVNSLKMVPVIHYGAYKWFDLDNLLLTAEQGSYQNGHPQEGIVIRPLRPERHNEIGLLSFKVINNQYLLKIGE